MQRRTDCTSLLNLENISIKHWKAGEDINKKEHLPQTWDRFEEYGRRFSSEWLLGSQGRASILLSLKRGQFQHWRENNFATFFNFPHLCSCSCLFQVPGEVEFPVKVISIKLEMSIKKKLKEGDHVCTKQRFSTSCQKYLLLWRS